MKKALILSAVVLSALFISSCKKEAVKVDTDISSKMTVSFSIPADTSFGYKEFDKQIVNSELEAKLTEYKASLSDVKSIVVESMVWELNNDSSMTFDALDNVDCYFSLDGSTTTKVANLDPVEHNGSKAIKLTSSNIDVLRFLSQKSFYVVCKGKTNAKVRAPQPVKITINYKINASVTPL